MNKQEQNFIDIYNKNFCEISTVSIDGENFILLYANHIDDMSEVCIIIGDIDFNFEDEIDFTLKDTIRYTGADLLELYRENKIMFKIETPLFIPYCLKTHS